MVSRLLNSIRETLINFQENYAKTALLLNIAHVASCNLYTTGVQSSCMFPLQRLLFPRFFISRVLLLASVDKLPSGSRKPRTLYAPPLLTCANHYRMIKTAL